MKNHEPLPWLRARRSQLGATALAFSGGAPFQGRFFNLIGKGYSQLDGFGFVNAEAAVNEVRRGHLADWEGHWSRARIDSGAGPFFWHGLSG